jgi:hypothetical protein
MPLPAPLPALLPCQCRLCTPTPVSIVHVHSRVQCARMSRYLEWFDASIHSPAEAARAREDHFVPAVAFENNVGDVEKIGEADVRQGDSTVGHMKLIRKYAGTFRSRATVKECVVNGRWN